MMNETLFGILQTYLQTNSLPCPSFEAEPITFEYIWKKLKWVYNDRRFFELLHIDY